MVNGTMRIRSCLLVFGVCQSLLWAADTRVIHANNNTKPAGHAVANERVIRLVIDRGRWFPEADDGPSIEVEAFGEDEGDLQVPGPLVRVRQGNRLHVFITNRLTKA